jgi:hypothetical protein
VVKSFSYVLAIKSFLKIVYYDYTLKAVFLKVIRGKNSNFGLKKKNDFGPQRDLDFLKMYNPRVSAGCTQG